MRKFKNETNAGKDEVSGGGKGGCNMVVYYIWSQCHMAFESGVVPEDWKSAKTVPLCKGTGEMTECKNYRGISKLSGLRNIYVGILLDRLNEGLIEEEQGCFISESGL